MTPPRRAILQAACQRGGGSVGGRNMVAVDALEKAGMITVRWIIEGARFSGPTRWAGDTKATDLGRKTMRELDGTT